MSGEAVKVPIVQMAVVADLLSGRDVEGMLRCVKDNCLRPEHFTDPESRAAFEAILKCGPKSEAILSEAVAAATSPKFLADVSAYVTDPQRNDFQVNVKHVAQLGRKSEKVRLLDEWRKKMEAASPEKSDEVFSEGMSEIRRAMREQENSDNGGKRARRLDELPVLSEEEKEARQLLGNGWLRKGQAAMVVSVSGAGKSVLSMQLAYAWARGRPVFSIPPARPLKIGIYQTEDDLEDLQFFRTSMREGAKRYWNWTDADIAAAERNITLFDKCVERNAEFVERMRDDLEDEIEETGKPFDLIIVNPLHAFAGVNVSDNTEMSKFLRGSDDGIDSVIKDGRIGCGLLAIHHTGKPPQQGNGRPAFGSDQFAQYLGFGASELPNYMRAMLILNPQKANAETESREFALVAAKRESRLDWKVDPKLNSALPAKLIRHAPKDSGIAFWLEGEAKGGEAKSARRLTLDECIAQLVERFKASESLTLTEASKVARKCFGKLGTDAYNAIKEELKKHGGKYKGLVLSADATTSWKKYIGPAT